MIFYFLVFSLATFLSLFGRVALPYLVCLVLGLAAALCAYRFKRRHHVFAFLALDEWAANSPLRAQAPSLKFACTLALLGLNLLSPSPWPPLFTLLVVSALSICYGKVSLSNYMSLLLLPLSFIALSVIALTLQFSPEPLGLLDLRLGQSYLCLSYASQTQAHLLTARALAGFAAVLSFALCTPLADIIALLRRLCLPNIIIELMYLIYRYIFVLFSIFHNMHLAADSRLGYRNYRSSLKTSLQIASALFQQSYRRAARNFEAMESRCYEGKIAFIESSSKAGKIELLLVLGYVLLYALLIYLLT